jgi:hypothetical protein|tara:strand:- start:283 stop:465 length:183 start_codon:yes stop_codon:yes gene_type:complete
MKLLELMLEEQKRLKSIGFQPKFKGDTGMNVAKLMIDNDVELRNEWDESFVDGFKQLNNK